MKRTYCIVIFLVATVLISVCFHKYYVDNNAHEREKSNYKESDSYSNRNDMNTAFCLDAKKVGSHIEKNMFVNVDEFFEDNEKYKDLTSLVDAIAKETPDLPVSGQKEFYVSKTAIYYWKPKDNSINKTMVDLFVFSKDKQSIFEYTMLYRNGKFTGGSINKLDVFTTDVILKHKKTRFVIFHEVDENSNSSAPILLSENNQLYQAAGSGEYNVRGDYFEKLAALSFSYDTLTENANLKKIVLK